MAEALTSVRREPGHGRRRQHSWTLKLTGEPCDARIARTHASRALGSMEPDVVDDVLLVVSELVTNAVLHGRGPITLSLCIEPDVAVVAVTDRGSEIPSLARQDIDDEHGRGLRIVQRLTATWDVEREPRSKTITAVVNLQPTG